REAPDPAHRILLRIRLDDGQVFARRGHHQHGDHGPHRAYPSHRAAPVGGEAGRSAAPPALLPWRQLACRLDTAVHGAPRPARAPAPARRSPRRPALTLPPTSSIFLSL